MQIKLSDKLIMIIRANGIGDEFQEVIDEAYKTGLDKAIETLNEFHEEARLVPGIFYNPNQGNIYQELRDLKQVFLSKINEEKGKV